MSISTQCQHLKSLSSQFFMRSLKIIRLLVLENKNYKRLFYLGISLSSWSCDLGHLFKLLLPFPKEAPYTIMAMIGQVVLDKKMFENNVQKHIYNPAAGANNILWSNVFIN